MKLSQYHTSIQQALIITAKFGFISREIFNRHITPLNHRSYKYKQWMSLIGTGFLKSYSRTGVAEDYYSLSRRGYSFMKDNGFNVVSKAHPLHFEHDGIVMNFTVASELAGLIEPDWWTEKNFRQADRPEQIRNFGYQLEKLPDLLFKIKLGNRFLNCAFEVERSRKSKNEYDSIVLSYLKDKVVNMIYVAYKDRYIRDSFLKSIKRLSYPQGLRPFVFCKIGEVLDNSTGFKLEVADSVIAFDQYVKNMKNLSQKNEDNDRRHAFPKMFPNKETAA